MIVKPHNLIDPERLAQIMNRYQRDDNGSYEPNEGHDAATASFDYYAALAKEQENKVYTVVYKDDRWVFDFVTVEATNRSRAQQSVYQYLKKYGCCEGTIVIYAIIEGPLVETSRLAGNVRATDLRKVTGRTW